MCSTRTTRANGRREVSLQAMLVILWVTAFSLLTCGTAFGARLRVRGHDFYRYTTPVELWAVDVAETLASDDSTDEVLDNLARYAEFGVNTVGLELQCPECPAFSMDGQRFDGNTARRLRRILREADGRWMPTVITVFSPEKSAWLATSESYLNAVKLLTRACARVDTIFALGTPDVPAECPFRLDDVESLLELCRTIKRVNRGQVVGVCARDIAAFQAISDSQGVDVVFVSDVGVLDRARTLGGGGIHKPVIWIQSAALRQDFEALARSVSSAANEPGIYLMAKLQSLGVDDTPMRLLEQVKAARLVTSVREQAPANPHASILTEEEQREGWTALFDGQSLRGWIPLARDWGTWSVEDGVLKCSGGGGRWLRTLKRYKDFVLRLEFKLSRNCNSGVFVHAPLDARASRIGMEVQLMDHKEPSVTPESLGAIYSVLPPRVYAGRPTGEWNELEITCKGNRVVVNLNGQEVQNFTMDDHPLLKGRLSAGYIGLQDHGVPVWFRNIRVKELNTQP